jgi:hypothetical protein
MKTRVILPLLLLALALPVWGQDITPYRFGYFAANMKPEVLAAIVNAATSSRGRPWALFSDWGPVNAEPHTDAFYPPHTLTDRVRRGVVQSYRCTSTSRPRGCVDWEPVGKPGAYVQIAEMGTFTKRLRPRSAGEKPIIVRGTFSDDELVSLAEYVRSNRGPRQPFAVSGDDPVCVFARSKREVVTVILSADAIGGCTATIRQKGTQWEVTDCGCWVS